MSGSQISALIKTVMSLQAQLTEQARISEKYKRKALYFSSKVEPKTRSKSIGDRKAKWSKQRKSNGSIVDELIAMYGDDEDGHVAEIRRLTQENARLTMLLSNQQQSMLLESSPLGQRMDKNRAFSDPNHPKACNVDGQQRPASKQMAKTNKLFDEVMRKQKLIKAKNKNESPNANRRRTELSPKIGSETMSGHLSIRHSMPSVPPPSPSVLTAQENIEKKALVIVNQNELLRKENNALKKECDKNKMLNEENKKLKKECEQNKLLKEENIKLRKESHEMKMEINQLNQRISVFDDKLKKLEKQNETLQQSNNELKERMQVFELEHEKLRGAYDLLRPSFIIPKTARVQFDDGFVYVELVKMRTRSQRQKNKNKQKMKALKRQNNALKAAQMSTEEYAAEIERYKQMMIVEYRFIASLRSRHKTFREQIRFKVDILNSIIEKHLKESRLKDNELSRMMCKELSKDVFIRNLREFELSCSPLLKQLQHRIEQIQQITNDDLDEDDWAALSTNTNTKDMITCADV